MLLEKGLSHGCEALAQQQRILGLLFRGEGDYSAIFHLGADAFVWLSCAIANAIDVPAH